MNKPPALPRAEPGYSAETQRRAEALASVHAMHEELNSAHQTIGQLKADLRREEDRCKMFEEERNRYRAEALVFRTKLIELATAMSNIGLMTVAAQDVVKTVHDLTLHAETPTNAILEKMEEEVNGSSPFVKALQEDQPL